VKWWPELIDEISLKPPTLHLLFAPRQVGKTTLLKLLAEGGRDPRIIFTTPAKWPPTTESWGRPSARLQIKKRWGVSSASVLLDEVTHPREWYRALNFYLDQGHLQNDVIISRQT